MLPGRYAIDFFIKNNNKNNMYKNRIEAGHKLAEKLSKYNYEDIVVCGLAHGGIITAAEVAKELNAPLDICVVRKIGHPQFPEYAIGAILENGHMFGNESELMSVDQKWLRQEKKKQRNEARRLKKLYLGNIKSKVMKNKTVIIVDDGVATGLSMKLCIEDIKSRSPKRIVVATPVISEGAAEKVQGEIDNLVTLYDPENFLGTVSAHYEEYEKAEDYEVVNMIKKYKKAFLRHA